MRDLDVRVAGPLIDDSQHKHISGILNTVAKESGALVQLGLQSEDIRFYADVRAIQLSSSAQRASSSGCAQQPEPQHHKALGTADGDQMHPASACVTEPSVKSQIVLNPRLSNSSPGAAPEALQPATLNDSLSKPSATARSGTSTWHEDAGLLLASNPSAGGLQGSQLAHSASSNSLDQALAAVVDFLLDNVLSMQPSRLQTAYAVSALTFVNAAQAAQQGPCTAFQATVDRLSSGDHLACLTIAS